MTPRKPNYSGNNFAEVEKFWLQPVSLAHFAEQALRLGRVDIAECLITEAYNRADGVRKCAARWLIELRDAAILIRPDMSVIAEIDALPIRNGQSPQAA